MKPLNSHVFLNSIYCNCSCQIMLSTILRFCFCLGPELLQKLERKMRFLEIEKDNKHSTGSMISHVLSRCGLCFWSIYSMPITLLRSRFHLAPSLSAKLKRTTSFLEIERDKHLSAAHKSTSTFILLPSCLRSLISPPNTPVLSRLSSMLIPIKINEK